MAAFALVSTNLIFNSRSAFLAFLSCQRGRMPRRRRRNRRERKIGEAVSNAHCYPINARHQASGYRRLDLLYQSIQRNSCKAGNQIMPNVVTFMPARSGASSISAHCAAESAQFRVHAWVPDFPDQDAAIRKHSPNAKARLWLDIGDLPIYWR